MSDPVPTHTGWDLFCPVYLALDGEETVVWARHWSLEPLLQVCLFLQQMFIFLASAMSDRYEPQWQFWFVKKIEKDV